MSKSNKKITNEQLYNPLIEFAKNGDSRGYDYLVEVGKLFSEKFPEKFPSVEDGIRQAQTNLDYYCQYFDKEVANKVKDFYNLGMGWRTLIGKTNIPM